MAHEKGTSYKYGNSRDSSGKMKKASKKKKKSKKGY